MTTNGARLLGPLVLGITLVSCGSSGTDDRASISTSAASPTATDGSANDSKNSYCDAVTAAAGVLGQGGSAADYDQSLLAVTATSPPEHAETWLLMSTLNDESFSYDNFNAAIDALDDITDDLITRCPGSERMVIDDDGRMRLVWPN